MYLWTALITCLAIAVYFATSVLVSRARTAYGIKAPAITGNPDFERVFRVQMNTLEWLRVVPAQRRPMASIRLDPALWHGLSGPREAAVAALRRICSRLSREPAARRWYRSRQAKARSWLWPECRSRGRACSRLANS